MMNSHAGIAASPMFAKHCFRNLRSCEYAPALRTVKDCGYQQIKELGADDLKSELQAFINFEQAGTAQLKDEAHSDGQLMPFGYITNLPPYEVQKQFVIPIDAKRLHFKPDCDDL